MVNEINILDLILTARKACDAHVERRSSVPPARQKARRYNEVLTCVRSVSPKNLVLSCYTGVLFAEMMTCCDGRTVAHQARCVSPREVNGRSGYGNINCRFPDLCVLKISRPVWNQ